MEYSFLNGEIVPAKLAKISFEDSSVARAYAIFEVLRSYNSRVFLFDEHLERLENSATIMGISLPLSKKDIKEATYKLIEKNKAKEFNIKIVVTGGRIDKGLEIIPGTENIYINLEKANDLPSRYYKDGIKLYPINHKREFPKAKTTNYLFPIVERRELKDDFFDFLYCSDNKVLESSTSSFFIIKDDVLITPKENVLAGITKRFVIDLCKDIFKIEERDIDFSEIDEAQEAFLTATKKEVLPVVGIGGKKINDGLVGPRTKEIMNIFKEKISDY